LDDRKHLRAWVPQPLGGCPQTQLKSVH
jgi:hypothetical protein